MYRVCLSVSLDVIGLLPICIYTHIIHMYVYITYPYLHTQVPIFIYIQIDRKTHVDMMNNPERARSENDHLFLIPF